ncbi:MAG: flagellar basal-body MS-ring/collar protein FliF [Rhizobacter sp.]
MWMSDYWGALTARQRTGLGFGTALILAGLIGTGVWLLRDPYVPLASGLSTERLNELAQELERAKLSYRINEGGDSVSVVQSQLGKARAAAGGGPFGVPPSVGLELFKEADFSSNDFSQRINYQRALQGELTRTIQTIAGVRSARVHVILPDAGLFKRAAAKASAAVSVALQPGKLLTRAQVRGIQRLVTASVPEIKIDDVVVLDESGAGLTRPAGNGNNEGEGDLSSAQLDLKRQADQYLESKLQKMLQEMAPQATASLSVDTVLDERQLRVTTEEPLAARGPKDAEHATGVLVKERQSQHGRAATLAQTGGDTADAESTDWEYEYKVGHRLEQTLSAPGSIKRVSVAVALQGAPAELSAAAIEQLVAHAVGIDRSRGDSVAVVLLPAVQPASVNAPALLAPHPREAGDATAGPPGADRPLANLWLAVAAAIALAVAAAVWSVRDRAAHAQAGPATPGAEVDVDAVTAKVRQWLSEGAGHGSA